MTSICKKIMGMKLLTSRKNNMHGIVQAFALLFALCVVVLVCEILLGE